MHAKWAAIFDWDGVILDSSKHHEESWERLAKEEGKILPEGHFLRGFGRRNVEIMRDLLQWSDDLEEIQRLSLRKEELYREVVEDWGIQSLPGVRTWLERLEEAGIPCAIGSSTEQKNVRLGLCLLGLESFFSECGHGRACPKGETGAGCVSRSGSQVGIPSPALCGF